jgi:hypothetical protein
MIATIRRLHLLAALALLLSGLLQTVASAQGVACSRAAASGEPAPVVDTTGGVPAQAGAAVAAATALIGPPHEHATQPAPDGAGIPSSSCAGPALPPARVAAPAASPSRHLSPSADRAGGNTVLRSHFRPPRPS